MVTLTGVGSVRRLMKAWRICAYAVACSFRLFVTKNALPAISSGRLTSACREDKPSGFLPC